MTHLRLVWSRNNKNSNSSGATSGPSQLNFFGSSMSLDEKMKLLKKRRPKLAAVVVALVDDLIVKTG